MRKRDWELRGKREKEIKRNAVNSKHTREALRINSLPLSLLSLLKMGS